MKTYKKDSIKAVASERDWDAMLKSAGDRLLVVEFVAVWSQPCRAMAPYMQALSQQPEFRAVSFARVDIEACPSLGLKNNVLNAPTYSFYRRGVLLDSFRCAATKRK